MLRNLLRPALLLTALCATPAQAAVELLTSIKPLQLIAAAIQDGQGTPEVLLPPGASPHHYSLRPSDLRSLQQARLFYWIGPDMERFLEKPLEMRQQPSVALQALHGLKLRHYADAHDEHSDEHAGHDHDPGAIDPHLWLDQDNARIIARRMAADLSAADPAGAGQYQANLAAFEKRVGLLDLSLREHFKPLRHKPFFVFHDAFSYFEHSYRLKHRGVLALSDEVQPGARHVAQMRADLEAAGSSCLFHEPPQPPRLASSLTRELPVRLAVLDPLGSDIPPGPRSYEELLSHLGNLMAGCLKQL